MGHPRSTWTPKDDRYVEVAVSLTRTCIARGATLLPFRYADVLPEGALTLTDRENGTELKVEHLPPRELTGFEDYFQHIGLKPNDTLIFRVAADGSGDMEVKRQPRQPQAPPPTPKALREVEPQEERPPFLEWRPEPIEYQPPAPRREPPAPPAAPQPTISEALPEPEAPQEEELPEWEPPRATRQVDGVRERLANGRSWLLRALRRDAPDAQPAPPEPPVEPFRFQPRPEYAAPQAPAARTPIAPAPFRAPQPAPALSDWEEDAEWGAFALAPAQPTPQERTEAPAPPPTVSAPAPAKTVKPPAPPPDPLEAGETPVSQAPTPPPPTEIEAAPKPEATKEPRALPLIEGEELTLTKPAPAAPQAPKPAPAPEPVAPSEAAPGRSGGEEGEALRLVREYLARPETPAIVRVQNVSSALGLDVEVAASLLAHVAGEKETRLNRIREDAYLLKRAG